MRAVMASAPGRSCSDGIGFVVTVVLLVVRGVGSGEYSMLE
jgi:hypothetical protein